MFDVRPIGFVASPLLDRMSAPKPGDEGAPNAHIVLLPEMQAGAADLRPGDRDVVALHPRGDASRPRTGVFSTRSPDRPNPIGLHRVRIVEISAATLTVNNLEAIDGTPVIDIKPVMGDARER